MQKEFNSRGAGVQTPDGITVFLNINQVLGDFKSHLQNEGKADEKGKPKWEELDRKWWSTIPVFPGAKKFYADLKKLGQVKFLSSPIPSVDGFAGKADWLTDSFATERGRFALLDLITCPARSKHFLAGPGHILVDDDAKSVEAWKRSGGLAVHHKGDFAETLQAVEDAIAAYRQDPSLCKVPEGEEIFIDLDGVLSNFEEHLHSEGKAKPDGSPNWDALDHQWWSTMPIFKEAKSFVYEMKKLGSVNFLSAPIPHADSFSGKAQWIADNLGPKKRGRFALLNLVLCSAKDKYFLAGPGRVLVDDRIKNVDEWIAAGGIGIHHKGDFKETLKAVEDALAAFRQKNAAPTPPVPPLPQPT